MSSRIFRNSLGSLVAAILSLTLFHNAAVAESASERVNRTGVIRCGYAVWPGLVEKDPNTQQLSGMFVEYMQELARAAELTVEWTGEYGWGDFIEALHTGKIDAMCAGIWTNAVRGKRVLFSTPMAFQSIVPVVRVDDARFDSDIQKVNDPAVKIVVADGESALTIATTDFPLASLHSLPQRTDAGVMLANVTHRKGDVTFVDLFTAMDFQAKNPNKIKIVPTKFPVRVFGITIAVGKNDAALKSTFDAATEQLLWTGRIDQLLKRNEKLPGSYLQVSLPFAVE